MTRPRRRPGRRKLDIRPSIQIIGWAIGALVSGLFGVDFYGKAVKDPELIRKVEENRTVEIQRKLLKDTEERVKMLNEQIEMLRKAHEETP